MNAERHITKKILLFLNVTGLLGAVILKIINPIVVSYTDEIKKADLLNFTVFVPIILIIISILIYRSLRPLRALYPLKESLTTEQMQELRTAAFNVPIKIIFQYNTVALSIVAFVALGVDSVLFKFYPIHKRVISMGLIWAYTISTSLAVYIYSKHLMKPVLRYTSGVAEDRGYRVSIKANVIVTTLTLSAMTFLFLSVYGYSQAREAFVYKKGDNLLFSIKNEASEFKDEQELKNYIKTIKSNMDIFIMNSDGDYITDKSMAIPPNFDIKQLFGKKPSDGISIYEAGETTLKTLPLGKSFDGLYLGAAYKLDPAEQQKLRTITLFFIVIGGFFLIFAGGISYYVANDTAMDVKHIKSRMKNISEEKETLYKEFEIVSLDEVGDLTRAFNTLQKTIQHSHQELEAANKKLLDMERKQAQEALQKSEERYRLLAENVTDVIWTVDMTNLKYTYVSPSITHLLGYSPEDVIGMTADRILAPSSYAVAIKALGEEMAIEKMGNKDLLRSRSMEFEHIRKDGSSVWAEVRMTFLRSENGQPIGILGVTRDISERKKLEDQLRHSQKLEAVGTLTGGIAHDFNNILTTIMNCGSVLQMKMEKDDPLKNYVTQILASSERAANLTQSLLAFSRKQLVTLRPININTLVNRVERLLARLIGEDIELKINLTNKDLIVMGDSGQIEQVVMNLSTNARDAMPDGGKLNISTELVEIDERFLKTHGYGKPGMYALISVSDTGTGIDEKTRERIFEPFFTTKEVGKGTGLGLSIVYGIIKQHNGYINCYSDQGHGTTFKIYLPFIKAAMEEVRSMVPIMPARGTETVLLAEDNVDLRMVAKDILEEFGYTVIAAIDGADALTKYTQNKDNIHLLLLDVIMPKKNGKEVFDIIKKIKPDVKAIFVSGYAADIINKKGLLEEGLNFISKPLLPTELLKKIREVLDQ